LSAITKKLTLQPNQKFNSMKTVFQISILLLMFCAATGCGRNVSISGKVTFSDDGSPVPTGFVVFDDGTKSARAPIKSNGSFVMGFDKENNGVPNGTYAVTISGVVKLLPNPDNVFPPPTEELIDAKYSDKETSGLSIIVDGSRNTFDIKVDRSKR
jgi:hypothetical protein